jgi:hypothetical protein
MTPDDMTALAAVTIPGSPDEERAVHRGERGGSAGRAPVIRVAPIPRVADPLVMGGHRISRSSVRSDRALCGPRGVAYACDRSPT